MMNEYITELMAFTLVLFIYMITIHKFVAWATNKTVAYVLLFLFSSLLIKVALQDKEV